MCQVLDTPITHIINSIFEQQCYPTLWKKEYISPVPKVFPVEQIAQMRPISGVVSLAKITDRILAEYMLADMSEFRDKQQYGNEKGVSLNHLLLKMINKILTSVDNNTVKEKYAVILTMLDMSQAFERQSHNHGVRSLIDQGVRPSLIPVLVSFFQERNIVVKWNGHPKFLQEILWRRHTRHKF